MIASPSRLERKPALANQRLASLSGSLAVAEAMRQTNPDVVAAYPITPSTLMVEKFSEYVANRLVDTEFVAVESEHSAMSACVGASAAGGRAQTVTSSQGLAYMWEVLYVAAGLRLPIVLHCANRALSSPINIHCDHSDTMGARDSGWIQLYAENPQEAYDNALMAVRIAEHGDVLLPVLHTQDGFTVTHSLERVELLDDKTVAAFLGDYSPAHPVLDTRNPVTLGAIVMPDALFEMKRQNAEAMHNALRVIGEVGEEFGEISGRHYGLLEKHMVDDADLVVVVLGSTAGTARTIASQLRVAGMKVGVLRVRSFRPFPTQELAETLRGKAAVGVMDRAFSFGAAANPLFAEVMSALYLHGMNVPLINYVYGIGGRDATPGQLASVYRDLALAASAGSADPMVRYLGLRGP
ncbi:MAG: pyruvate ferredoxin oxidoreductase [Chloroflexi bacterium]|nr:pyruvate ferredoxin oxidoreductase [Chloroflexota bacterium]